LGLLLAGGLSPRCIAQSPSAPPAARDSTTITNLAPGLRGECYEGFWEKVPNFDLLRAVKTGITTNINLEMRTRAMETLSLVAEGRSNKEIGARLSISLATVRNHFMRFCEQLRVRCRTEAAAKCLRSGPSGARLRPHPECRPPARGRRLNGRLAIAREERTGPSRRSRQSGRDLSGFQAGSLVCLNKRSRPQGRYSIAGRGSDVAECLHCFPAVALVGNR
jgi:DNA-binding CsgD family transcriptional regulator